MFQANFIICKFTLVESEFNIDWLIDQLGQDKLFNDFVSLKYVVRVYFPKH